MKITRRQVVVAMGAVASASAAGAGVTAVRSAYRHLDLEGRIEVLRGWLHSDLWLLRNGITALLVLIGVGWTTHPEVLPFVEPHFSCGYGR